MKTDFISTHYLEYLNFLRKLASLPSVFSNPKDVEIALQFCKNTFEVNLPHYNVYFDTERNLIAIPPEINYREDIIYLSAHIDTVGADSSEWNAPFQPWEIYEDRKEIVGRGVNDCKAGAAYQLFLSLLAKQDTIKLSNIIFTITFKEEGAGNKTSKEIAKNLGKKLPISEKSTYLIVLENNVRIKTPPTLCIYTSERSSFVIKIVGFIPQLQKYLSQLPHWNPVCVRPQEEVENLNWQTSQQVGGHVCSVSREKNLLTKIILEAKKNSVIKAGEEKSFAVIPSKILLSQSGKPLKHALIISNRSFDSLEDVLQQLRGINYEALKDFSISVGFNIEDKFLKSKILKIMNNCKNSDELDLEYTYNIGASDGSIIYNSLDLSLRKEFYPIIMGPGSRSQRELMPPRLTHGKNETFDKESGKRAIIFISEVLGQLHCII